MTIAVGQPLFGSGDLAPPGMPPPRGSIGSLLSAELVSAEFLQLIPRDFARQHLLISQGRNGSIERLAVTDTTEPAAVYNVGVRLGMTVDTQPAPGERIAQVIDEAYRRTEQRSDMSGASSNEVGSESIEQLLAVA